MGWNVPSTDGSHDLLSEFKEPAINIEQIVAPFEQRRARIARNTVVACTAVALVGLGSELSHFDVRNIPYGVEWSVPAAVQAPACAGFSCMPVPRLVPAQRVIAPVRAYSVLDPGDRLFHAVNAVLFGAMAFGGVVGAGLYARTYRLERDAVFDELNKPFVHKYYWSI